MPMPSPVNEIGRDLWCSVIFSIFQIYIFVEIVSNDIQFIKAVIMTGHLIMLLSGQLFFFPSLPDFCTKEIMNFHGKRYGPCMIPLPCSVFNPQVCRAWQSHREPTRMTNTPCPAYNPQTSNLWVYAGQM